MSKRVSSGVIPLSFALGMCVTAGAGAEPTVLTPEWVTRIPAGMSLENGSAGMVVDSAGVSYITGTTGPSSNKDITTAAVEPDGSLRWSRTWDGPAAWHDQARGIVLRGGLVYVTGNTPGPGTYANVLVLAYEAATGNLVRTIQYSSGPQTSEHGASVAVDVSGRMFVAGGTLGDGGDALVVAFDSAGSLLWVRTWDGPAWGPFSQDNAQEVLIDPSGNPVVMIHGVMGSSQPDYVVVKYEASSGAVLWQANWGVNGGDYPRDMEVDAQGDVYVTGTGIDGIDKYSTIKLRGSDGGLVWQAYDSAAPDNSAYALALDGQGGVFITGAVDPDGDHSNFNDDIYTVKRDAAGGAQRWTHRYGASCLYCYDVPSDVIVDPAGHVFVAGSTSSPPYSGDAILLVLDTATGLETERGIIPGGPGESASFRELRFDSASGLRASAHMSNASTGAVDMAVVRYASLGGGGPISCRDVSSVAADCVSRCGTNQLQVRVALADGSHDGQQVGIEVDEQAYVVDVEGAWARMVVEGAVMGAHPVTLTDPAGCFATVTATCPLPVTRRCAPGTVSVR